MIRRGFVASVVGAAFAAPTLMWAQPASQVARIGFVGTNTADAAPEALAAFRQGLREHGWIEGQNIVIEFRFAEGRADRLPALVAELIRLKVDLIVAGSSAPSWAARQATTTMPIVMATSSNALAEGLVGNLARPGGNITGMTFLAGPEIAGKQLELLRELAPSSFRIAVLANPDNGSHTPYLRAIGSSAVRLGAQLKVLEARSAEQLEQAFIAMPRAGATALLVLTDSVFFGRRRSIVAFAAMNGLPAMYSQREFVEDGGLASYGPSLAAMYRRAAAHVHKILRGVRPADLPVEQPTKFELAINLKTAQALGLTVSQSLLLRADEVVR